MTGGQATRGALTPLTGGQGTEGALTPLTGGTANRGLVFRVGQTVRRPATPYRAATHALLAHLAAVGFDGAPRLLGADAATDTLSYIEGQAATAPLAGETLTDTALVSIAGLLRRYHEAAASFSPAGLTAGPGPSRPGSPPAWSATTTSTRPTSSSALAARWP